MRQRAYVTTLLGSDAMVVGERSSACGDCAGKGSCSTLGSWRVRSVEMRVLNAVGAHVGDEVEVEVEDHFILKASFRLYMMPMVAFLLSGLMGWWLAQYLTPEFVDLISALSAIAGVAACYVWIWYQDRRMEKPVASIVAILTES